MLRIGEPLGGNLEGIYTYMIYMLRYRGTQHIYLDKNAAMALGRRPKAVLQSSSKYICWKLPNSHTRSLGTSPCVGIIQAALDVVECDL